MTQTLTMVAAHRDIYISYIYFSLFFFFRGRRRKSVQRVEVHSSTNCWTASAIINNDGRCTSPYIYYGKLSDKVC